jgi:hypothetical protein
MFNGPNFLKNIGQFSDEYWQGFLKGAFEYIVLPENAGTIDENIKNLLKFCEVSAFDIGEFKSILKNIGIEIEDTTWEALSAEIKQKVSATS